MKPLKLEFKGINSFSDRTEIDFEKVSASGLFGIFGKTGSGKSTILDCMMYALFSRTSRKQTIKEYINVKCSEAYVEFTFEVLDCGIRRKYKVKKTLKINKRGSVDTSAVLSEINDDCVLPLCEGEKANERIKEIIGIGFEEFSRCIILPQNEFASFVKSQRTERLSNVCKLFNLEKYDFLLTKKLKEKKYSTDVELSGVKGELKHYEQYSKEYLKNLKDKYTEILSLKNSLVAENEDLLIKIKADEELYSDTKKYNENKKVLEFLSLQKEEIEVYKDKIIRSESANVVKKAAETLELEKVGLNKEVQRKDVLQKELLVNEENLNKVTAEETSLNVAEYDKIIHLIGLLESNVIIAEKVDTLREEYSKRKKSLTEDEKSLEELNKSIENAIKEIEKIGSPDEELFTLTESMGADVLKNELKEELEYFKKSSEKIKPYVSIEVGALVYNELQRKIEEVSERITKTAMTEKDADFLSSALERIKRNTSKLNVLKQEYNGLCVKKATCEQKIEQNRAYTVKLLSEGKEYSSVLDGVEKQSGYTVNSKNKIFAAITDLKEKKESFALKRDSIAKRKSGLQEIISSARENLAALSVKIAACNENVCKYEKELNQLLNDGKFSSALEAEKYALDENSLSLYNYKINEYEKKYSQASALNSSLEGFLSAKLFDEKQYEFLLQKSKDLSVKIEEIKTSETLCANDINQAEKKLAEAERLDEKRTELQKKFDLMDKLEKVLYGRNLLEFIAEEYLSEISFNASRTLLMLTSGRYDLIYEGEFFVADNLDCGEKRPVSTLSGGETFLVSLSLALALSQAICEKTNRPVEFFFLDEGFGTLDDELTEVVLDSLDKLKNANFTIGLISHVQELKQRIQSKILVSIATAAHGSSVEVVY